MTSGVVARSGLCVDASRGRKCVLSPIYPAIDLYSICDKQEREGGKVDVLYHYTDAHGLLGLLGSPARPEIWATHFKYLNDASEWVYAQELLKRVVAERVKTEEDLLLNDFLHMFLGDFFSEEISDIYVACFCEKDDVLSQWRAYAGASGAYALGFRSDDVASRGQSEHDPQEPRFKHELFRVVYDETVQRRHLNALIDCAMKSVKKYAMDAARDSKHAWEVMTHHKSSLTDYIIRRMLAFKHPEFSVEQEWRLCHQASDETAHVQYRAGRYGVTPYVCLDISPTEGPFEGRMPLVSVTCGPSVNLENSKRAVIAMLESRKFKDVKVTGTTLPLRL